MSLPLTTHDDKGISFTVDISVGGGAPFPVLLDTGSTGLYVEQGVVGSAVTTPSPAQNFSMTYAKGQLTGTLQSAVVDLGGVSTSGPVTFGTYASGSGNSSFGVAAKGILGIAAGSGGENPTVMAVQGLLPAPYDSGSTLTGAQLGGSPGSWVLGPVAAPAAGAVQVPLTAEGSGGGVTGWGKDVTLCWAFNQGTSTCGATDLDSGAGSVLLGEGKPGVPAASETLTDVAITTPSGQAVWSFAPGSSTVQTEVMTLGGATVFNTSNHIYLGRTIAFDYVGGTVTIGPASS
ncbi:hypothetical protein JL107_15840 [Nakamurella flavida]|uniref:Uncharacterized protein n=1 Tax=Nakamurella flavida TaxID=363630 RepID=A0A938YHS1_9ACTN|nr:hypothetical protein [Nakamurella flavida]MBM9477920.1 hypothetical protein [Nakamurella flavida]MDP9778365.1 hypothetical protein [Nakamurella flavida]